MTLSPALTAELPAIQPEDPAARLVLFGFRQMATHGLADACAAHAFVTAFGKGFRRPLVLLRAFVAEISGTSANPIRIAPWCCPRMTAAEAALIEVLRDAPANPARTGLLLRDLLGTRDADGVAATAGALAIAFAELGLPIE